MDGCCPAKPPLLMAEPAFCRFISRLSQTPAMIPTKFVPTKKMLSHGPGAIMVGPFRFPESVPTPAGYSGVIQPVIVHAILDQKGKVLDAEVVQSADPALASVALEVVWHSSYLPAQQRGGQLQREAFINVKFTPAS